MNNQKAKIVDLNADYAVVLTDSGAFKRVVRKGDMSVGSGIYITDQDLYLKTRASTPFKIPVFGKRLLQVTGVMALLIMILFTQSFTPMSYAVISVDINPSIQLFIDADYNVVKIESMNADGKNLLSKYDFIKNKSASSVLTELFTLATEMDYFESDQNEILIAAAIYEPSKAKANALQIGSDANTIIDSVLSKVDYSIFEQENVVINAVTSNAKNIKAADKEHLTIGQYEKDHHSDTVKTYAIVEDGKHIKTNKNKNDNANTPAETSDEEIDDNGQKETEEETSNETEKDNGTNNGTNNGNNNMNGNTNENNKGNNNTDNNQKSEIKPHSGIDNIKSNVKNSNFAGNKNKKQFMIEKNSEINSIKENTHPKKNN